MSAPGAPPTWSARRLPSASLVASRISRYLPALVVFFAFIAMWEVMTTGTGRRVIPPPSAVTRAMASHSNALWLAATRTYYEAIGGLVIGTTAGVAVAFATARWASARDVLLPVAIGAGAIPLVAAAPIMINWFGILNPVSMMMMAALLVFFPIMVNVTRGLMQVQPSALELMRSYATSPSDVLRKVRVPNMLPFFFTALKVSTTLAFIGAIVGEYFGGAPKVIGKVVMASMSDGSFDLAWAAIVIGACGAIVAYLLVTLVERLTIPWYVGLRSGDG